MTPDYPALVTKLDEIEAELRRLGFLVGEVGPPREVTSAFGLEDMPFEHWLSHVFLPRAREAIADRALPASSSVAAMALRNLDGHPDAETLIALLYQFDGMI